MPSPVDPDTEELYEYVTLAGVDSPGKVTLSGHDRVIEWDVKAGPGQSGATTTFKGDKPIEFTASFYLVIDYAQDIDDVEEWDAFADLIRSTVAGKTPKALEIYHPDLAANGISSVVMKSMGGPVYDGKGGQTVAVKFLEYRPAKAKGGTPNGAKTKKPDVTDPNAEAKAELARLTQQYKDTPWG